VCLIRETKNTRSVGVPPGTGLGSTELDDAGRFKSGAGLGLDSVI